MDKNYASGIRWNLADLYASADDPKLAADLDRAEALAQAFEKAWKPALEAFAAAGTPFDTAALLKDYKALIHPETKVAVFAHLSFAEQTDDAKRGAFLQKIQDRLTNIHNHLLFWGILWCKAPEAAVRAIVTRPELAADRHYLEDMRKYAPHTLSEPEEKILSIKDNTGSSAFSRLFDETVNKIPFYIEEGGKRVQKTETEVLALLHSPDRAVRKAGSESLAEGLKANSHLLTYIYNMILADHRSSMKLRGYTHPADGRNLANETRLPVIENLIKSVKAAYPIAQRYYKLKGKLLGLDPLYDYDRYASLSARESGVSFDECKRIVLAGYRDFSPEAAKIVEQFFDKRWIDAEVRPGKQGGGFCCQTTPDLHPYILVNYTGHLRDVLTVAHELGHGLHQYLAGRKVGILESDAPLTMAETASVFGEMLIFDRILGEVKDPKERLALLCGKIDDNFATVFRQIAMTDFELKAHLGGMKDGELAEEALNGFWIEANSELYGKSVILTENYRHGWKYIPHFVHTPFYCYAYSFAQLFVLALYQKYKETGAAFVPKYLDMLALGGSKKPEELAAGMGLNLEDPEFWNSGLKLLDALVQEAESLSK